MVLKKALFVDENRNKSTQNGISSVLCQNEESMQTIASFSSEQAHFTHCT